MEAGGKTVEAKLMLRSSWKRGVVVQGSGEGAMRMCRLVSVPVELIWVIVIPVADLPSEARISNGGKVRCWRQVVG